MYKVYIEYNTVFFNSILAGEAFFKVKSNNLLLFPRALFRKAVSASEQ